MSQYMMCGNSTTPDSALATPAPSADQAYAADNLAEALAGLSVSPPELPAENVSGEQTDAPLPQTCTTKTFARLCFRPCRISLRARLDYFAIVATSIGTRRRANR